MKETIDTLEKCLQEKPLYFRWKSVHRITPGVEKYHGQYYTLEISDEHMSISYGSRDMLKLEEIKPKLKTICSHCIDLFYEFENYCVDYLKVKKKVKPDGQKI